MQMKIDFFTLLRFNLTTNYLPTQYRVSSIKSGGLGEPAIKMYSEKLKSSMERNNSPGMYQVCHLLQDQNSRQIPKKQKTQNCKLRNVHGLFDIDSYWLAPNQRVHDDAQILQLWEKEKSTVVNMKVYF